MENNFIDTDSNNVIMLIRESLNIDESDQIYKCLDMALNKFHKSLISILTTKLPDALENNPVIKYGLKMAGGFIADFTVRLVKSFFKFLYVAFQKPGVWKLIWNSCIKTWHDNAYEGVTAQIYAFSKKFCAYLYEICFQCFVKSLEASDLVLKEEEKKELANLLFNSEQINENVHPISN